MSQATPVREAAGTSGGLQQLVIFALAGEHYALPIASVSEIIRHSPPRSVMSTSPWVRGVIALRGNIVPIYDLAARLNLPVEPHEGKIAILEIAGELIGVTVDDVDEVVSVASEQLEDLPAGGAEGVRAIAKLEDRLVLLLDPAGLFAGELPGT